MVDNSGGVGGSMYYIYIYMYIYIYISPRPPCSPPQVFVVSGARAGQLVELSDQGKALPGQTRLSQKGPGYLPGARKYVSISTSVCVYVYICL